jgi:hypothetical protein
MVSFQQADVRVWALARDMARKSIDLPPGKAFAQELAGSIEACLKGFRCTTEYCGNFLVAKALVLKE